MDPGEDLHQGRLAGPVLSDQRVCLAGMQFDGAVGQGMDGPEGLGDVLEYQQRLWPHGLRRRPGRPSCRPVVDGSSCH